MGYRKVKDASDATTLAASALRSVTENGSAVRLPDAMQGLVCVLDVTVDESTAADTLDVFIQTKVDGTNWVDVIHFTQHVGNATAKRYIAKIAAATAQAEFENGTALGAAAVRHLFGDEWRARWVIVDDSAAAAFTFSVIVCPM